MILRVRLTVKTEADIREIKDWGIATWGAARSREFLGGLRQTIELLAKHPQKGAVRRSLHSDVRAVNYRGYLVFYIMQDELLTVIGVIHERRNHAALDFTKRLAD